MQTFFLYLGISGLALALPAFVAAWLYRQDSQQILEAMSRVRRLPRIMQILLLAFVVQLIVHGSTKTNRTGYVEGGVTNGPSGLPPGIRPLGNPQLPLLQPGDGPVTVFGFTTNQLAAGFVMAEVGYGGSWSFKPPEGATVVADWLLRGAVEDVRPASSFVPVSSAPVVFADGRIQDSLRNPSLAYAPLNAALGVVPEANWSMIAGSNAESMVWHMVTASNTFVVTWRDVLLGRETNSPVSVQAEFFDDGSFVYRYDLARASAALSDPLVASNILIGAWNGVDGEAVDVSTLTNMSSLSSVSYHSVAPEDAVTADRDGDGIDTYDEIFTYHTDPGLCDSDGDGLSDGYEVAQSLDPLSVSVPNEVLLARLGNFQTNENYAAASVVVTNELVGYRLWDSFAATWPEGLTNLVYERTVRIDRHSGWEQYYLSSRPDAAGGWSLDGLVLEWEDSGGESGTATSSPAGDSMYLPLSTNGSSFVTFRLRATSTSLRSLRPVYLVGYAPEVTVLGDSEHTTSSGAKVHVFLDGSRSEIGIKIDRSRRPCKAALYPRELGMDGLADIASRSGGAFRYEGGLNGGRILASGAGVYQLPDVAVDGVAQTLRLMAPRGGAGRYIAVLMPWVKYGDEHVRGVGWDGEWYSVDYEYPLDSGCLVREWRRDSGGAWVCNCVPSAGCGLPDDNGLVTVDINVVDDTATATLKIGEDAIWSGRAVHVRDGESGGMATRIEYLYECGECDGGCENGDCSALEGPQLGSLKFRVPLGVARKDQVSGFAYFETEGPVSVSPSIFKFMLRSDVGAMVVTNGTTLVATATAGRGRSVTIEPVQHGALLTVRKHGSGELEHTWEVVNVDGNTNEIRIVQTSRIGNTMQDWTYSYGYSESGEGWCWLATDNISGICEELRRTDTLNEDGLCSEVRTQYDADGSWLGEVESVSQLIGERESSALREVYRREHTGWNVIERTADYWRDTEHPARNGRLRLLQSTDAPWEYHEWNSDGFETLRVEQRNASGVPAFFPSATSNGFENASALADAFLTTYSYAPLDGDDGHSDDRGKVRCESRYVVRGGVATLIGRTWHRYTHVYANGFPAVCEETWRASSPDASFDAASNASSWRTVFDSVTTDDVPLVLRGETAEEMDEDGIRTTSAVAFSGGHAVVATRKMHGSLQFPTYDVVVRDMTHGRVLRTETRLSDNDVAIEWCDSVYDDKGRLRSSTYHDGTSSTNAYSCCRLLWSQDRNGRKTLRSAVTGHDRLYYADEEVWLADVASNGYKVTQHFIDAFGRETNTVVYVGETPGEAVDLAASSGKWLSESRVSHAGTAYDAVDSFDVRGKVEMRRTLHRSDRDVTTTSVYPDENYNLSSESVETEWRNGPHVTRRTWDGKWTERRRWTEYDMDGCMVDLDVTESSDCGTVTNSVTRYDFLGRTVAVETPEGTTASVYDGATKRVLASSWAIGDVCRTAQNVHDGFGRLVGSVRDGVTSRSDETYELSSNTWWRVTRSAVFAGSVTNSASERRERLTGLSDAVRSQSVNTSADGVVTETTASYDAETGLMTETTVSSVNGTTVRVLRHGLAISLDTPDGTTLYEYDPHGRVVRETCGGRVVETAYDAAGDVVARRTRTADESFSEEAYAYDSFGNRIATTNALGEVTATAYDADGNVVEVSGAAYPVRYEYDTAGRLVLLSTTRDGTIWDVTTWQYDPATGRRISKRHADGSQAVTSYTADGLEAVVTRPSLQWKENVYDARRRLVGVVSNDGSENAAFEYDDFGRMTAASNAVSCTACILHRNGTATNELVSVGTNSFEIGRTVDMFGRLERRGVAGSESQRISYDNVGRICSITDQTATVTYVYSEDGTEAGYAISLASGANVMRLVTRDAYRPDFVASVSNIVNGVAVSGFGYQRDAEGRVLSRNDDTFSYNERGEVVFSHRGSENAEEDSYAYDDIGNLLLSSCNSSTNTYTANSLNQYTSILRVSASPRDISHDLDGNMLSDGLQQFTYDSAGRLSSVSTGGVGIAAFQYDAFGRRVRKTTPGAVHTYLYDGWDLVLERIEKDGGETDTIEYFWGKDMSGSLGGAGGIGGLLYLTVSNSNSQPQLYVPLYDANGNIMQYVDATGAVVASYVYDAFGRTLASAGSQAELFRFRFSTKYHDPESGLVYYGCRFYSPNLARWLTRDPLEEQGGLNLYEFCGNDAIGQVDPYGLAVEGSVTYDKIVALMEKTGVQMFWWAVAEKFFRGYKKWPISADMLLMSIYGNFGPGRHAFPENGQLAGAIRDSAEYKNIIDNLVQTQTTRHKTYKKSNEPINFNTKDLKTAVGHASYNLDGDICKIKSGSSARLNLRITVLDTYDFHMWGKAEIEANGAGLSFGNNLAYQSQQKGYLKTYPWSVSFDDNRRWPWHIGSQLVQ